MAKFVSVGTKLRLWCIVVLTVTGAIIAIVGISGQTTKVASVAQDR
jgi:hypothetical protein